MKKDMKLMKEKLAGIEEDRDWLERQLKASKKQNKLLRAGMIDTHSKDFVTLSDEV
jgi:hypothetical protein